MTDMELREVFNEAERALNTGGIEYGVVGGAALYTYGQLRMTKDLDILVPQRPGPARTSCPKRQFSRTLQLGPCLQPRSYVLGLPRNFLETQNGARVEYHGRRLVNPRGILQMKRLALQFRTSAHDAEDIEWLEENMERLDREIGQ
ncbi:hypothetical protein CDV55_102312 [Aspergillus turcosus]|nr:hypothetical protein CDV55_102312 [Aspergillus turcosus]